ncbi:unnamed protein product, partial [Dovyalis caffra]
MKISFVTWWQTLASITNMVASGAPMGDEIMFQPTSTSFPPLPHSPIVVPISPLEKILPQKDDIPKPFYPTSSKKKTRVSHCFPQFHISYKPPTTHEGKPTMEFSKIDSKQSSKLFKRVRLPRILNRTGFDGET